VLSGFVDRRALATGVKIGQLAGEIEMGGVHDNERFWVGSTPWKRYLIFLHIDAEAPFAIRTVSGAPLSGPFAPVPTDVAALGVTPSAGAEASTDGCYIEGTSLTDFRRGSVRF
jgi:hypothetical protein